MSTTATARRRPSVALIVIGSIVGLFGLALLAGAGTLLWADKTQRDSAGYFHTATHRFTTSSYAITRDGAKIDGVPGFIDVGKLGRIRIRAHSASSAPLFVGIAREADLARYLANVPHASVSDVHSDPFRATYERFGGSARPAVPATRQIWVASATGTAPTLRWRVQEGTWAAVVMNADGSRAVAADLSFGANIGYLGWIWGGLLIAGALVLAGGILLLVFGIRRGGGGPDAGAEPVEGEAGSPATAIAGTYPAVLAARLDEPLSRWLWLVKWLLLIPHVIVLAFLWIAFVLTTVFAWFAILVTSRYPRSIFDFNVGVARWTWRVEAYGYGALSTDRYPPFSLGREPGYPATLDVAYPAQLSRGLIFVKWLLALPHLLIVGILAGGGAYAIDHSSGWNFAFPSSGLIGLIALIAGIAMLFTARYPKGLFDLVVGLNRWVLRTVAYVALMTDEYPPFRLDQGGDEPPAAPVPPAAAGSVAGG